MFISVFIVIAAVIAGFSVLYVQNLISDEEHNEVSVEIERDFNMFVQSDVEKLSSVLDVLLQDDQLMEYYLRGDREELYEYTQSLFQNMRDDHDITHFYFIEPDGNCFVRIHNKDKYDDQINRFTFLEAQKTKEIGVGLELGKTAYALRVVKPYYNNGKLIGYLELGQEIDSFLDQLISGENNYHYLMVDKVFLNEDDWESVEGVRGERNSWDDMEKYVVIGSNEEIDASECFNSENADRVMSGETFLGELYINEDIFLCTGFLFVDASGVESGVVISLIDHTEGFVFIGVMKNVVFGAVLGFVIIAFVFWSFITKKITGAVGQLYGAVQNLNRGDFSKQVNIKTGDEFEELGDAFNRAMFALGRVQEDRKEIDAAKTRFLSITSHELRSPMTPMKAQLEMLMGGYFGNLNKKQKESMDIVLRNTTRLDRIIVDFLEISRIEAARLKFEFEKTSLAPHVKRLLDEMKGFMPEKNIKLELRLGNLPVMEVDPNRVGQILRNLINNAIKFSDPNGKVVISGGLSKGRIVFSVKDQGIGMSQEDQIRVFEPFYQAEQTIYREHQGTGLGLAICRGIVESQDGKIWVDSEKGKGSTFYFTVPLAPVKEIKAIKLLFSSQTANEKKIKELLQETLGPMFEKEFDGLKMRSELSKGKLYNYINSLKKQGIVTKEVTNEFKRGLDKIFGTGDKK